jgi:SAM-dependent methyltransferase
VTAEAGRAWVERWLLPRLAGGPPRDCVKLGPAGQGDAAAAAEAQHLAAAGHPCRLVLVPADAAPPLRLDAPDGAADLVLCGGFAALAAVAGRAALVAECARILRPGGHLLLHVGNRIAPVDLSGNAPLLHGPGAAGLMTLAEAEHAFVAAGPFARLTPLSAAGYQGWSRLPRAARPLGAAMDALWRHVLTPGRRRLYASALNPSLVLWIER